MILEMDLWGFQLWPISSSSGNWTEHRSLGRCHLRFGGGWIGRGFSRDVSREAFCRWNLRLGHFWTLDVFDELCLYVDISQVTPSIRAANWRTWRVCTTCILYYPVLNINGLGASKPCLTITRSPWNMPEYARITGTCIHVDNSGTDWRSVFDQQPLYGLLKDRRSNEINGLEKTAELARKHSVVIGTWR